MPIRSISARGVARTAIALAIAFPGLAMSALPSTYVAQSAAGTGNGSSCANARAASWFNMVSNWGTGSTQIGPGTTVYLCGTITTNLNLSGSGAVGSPITVDGAGAQYSGTFTNSGKSWWQVQNVRWVDGFTGPLMNVSGGSDGTFKGNYSDNFAGPNAVFLMQNDGVRPNRMIISNNYVRTTNTNLGNTQHDIIKSEGATNVVIEGNHLEMRVNGQGVEAHNDCIQTYEKGGTSGGPNENWTIRFNRIVMNSDEPNDRSWTMFERLGGVIDIYGNVFLGIKGAGSANGITIYNSTSGVVFNVFNNTIVAKDGASNNVFNISAPGTANLRNNIVQTANQTVITGGMSVVRSYNMWVGSRIPSCANVLGEVCGQSPGFVSLADNDFSLTAESGANASGSILTSKYAQHVNSGATWPSPSLGARSLSAAWSKGAYGSGAATTLPAPTGLQVW